MPSVRELLQRVTASELTELLCFVRREPVGGPVEDYREGLAAAVTMNLNRREGTPAVNPLDLYPWHKPPPAAVPADPETVARNVRHFINGVAQGVPPNGRRIAR